MLEHQSHQSVERLNQNVFEEQQKTSDTEWSCGEQTDQRDHFGRVRNN